MPKGRAKLKPDASERLEKAYDWLEEIQNSWSYGEQELRRCEAEIHAARAERER